MADREMPPLEFWASLEDLLREVCRSMGASGAVDQTTAALLSRIESALRQITPLLRELADHRALAHRHEIDAAHERGRLEGLAAGRIEGHRDGHEAGKAAALAERRGVVEVLTAPVATFASTKGGQAVLASVAIPVAILVLRACALGSPVAAIPAPVAIEAPDAP